MMQRRGWSLNVEVCAVDGGSTTPLAWADLPESLAKRLRELSDEPSVEFVRVHTDVKLLGAFAPRSAQQLADMLRPKYPALAAMLLEGNTDKRIADEIRSMVDGTTPVR